MATRLSKAYLLTKVLTASNHEVILYLYEGAISYLHRAGTALEAGREAEARQAIERAIGIVVELSGSLNYTSCGALALRLDAVYNHLIETLSMAAGNADQTAIDSCAGIMVILHDAWKQAAELTESRKMPRTADHQLQISA